MFWGVRRKGILDSHKTISKSTCCMSKYFPYKILNAFDDLAYPIVTTQAKREKPAVHNIGHFLCNKPKSSLSIHLLQFKDHLQGAEIEKHQYINNKKNNNNIKSCLLFG